MCSDSHYDAFSLVGVIDFFHDTIPTTPVPESHQKAAVHMLVTKAIRAVLKKKVCES
jgi:hypothetical protein